MSADPHRPDQPFNRLSDMADVRGHRLGIKTAEHLHIGGTNGNEQWRDLVELQCKLKAGTTLLEPIHAGDLQDAAVRMQRRVGVPA